MSNTSTNSTLTFLDEAGVSRLWEHLVSRINWQIKKTDITVDSSSWSKSTNNADYPYQATITILGATDEMIPDVYFDFADAISGNFASVASSSTDCVVIYAKAVPTTAITISAVILWP